MKISKKVEDRIKIGATKSKKVQCVNRYVIGQLVLREPVISVLRKELRKMADGIIVEPEEVEKILRAGVLRGDVMAEDEPEVQNAVHRVSKFYRQAAKKCEKKPAEKKDDPPPAAVPEEKPSLTEQLLKEAEAQEQSPASSQNAPNETK